MVFTVDLYTIRRLNHYVSSIPTGDPIADSYAFIARKNNALMVIADGVNWGEKSKIASRSAVDAVVNYITQTVFIQKDQVIHSTNVSVNATLWHPGIESRSTMHLLLRVCCLTALTRRYDNSGTVLIRFGQAKENNFNPLIAIRQKEHPISVIALQGLYSCLCRFH